MTESLTYLRIACSSVYFEELIYSTAHRTSTRVYIDWRDIINSHGESNDHDHCEAFHILEIDGFGIGATLYFADSQRVGRCHVRIRMLGLSIDLVKWIKVILFKTVEK